MVPPLAAGPPLIAAVSRQDTQKEATVRVTLHTRLRADSVDEYAEVHSVIPVELATALRRSGVRDWAIYIDGVDLFHVLEVDDYRAMRRAMRDDPANIAWQQRVGPLHEVADSYDGDDDGLPRLWSLTAQIDRS